MFKKSCVQVAIDVVKVILERNKRDGLPTNHKVLSVSSLCATYKDKECFTGIFGNSESSLLNSSENFGM